MLITAVHGIGQQQTGPESLLLEWTPAIADGIAFAGGDRKRPVPIDMAFYGNYFLPAPDAGPRYKGDAYPDAGGDDTDEEENDLVAAALEILTEDEVESAASAPMKDSFQRAPGRIPGLLAALDRKFGASAGVLYFGELRQARRYLMDPMLKQTLDLEISRSISQQCRILIAHSLGSVLAFEFVRQNPEVELDLLLTLGSPLGLRMMRSRMPDADFGSATSTGIPSNLNAWVNVRDLHDPVACAGDLSDHWPGIDERLVVNQKDAHSAVRYLRKKEVGQALLDAAPSLRS